MNRYKNTELTYGCSGSTENQDRSEAVALVSYSSGPFLVPTEYAEG